MLYQQMTFHETVLFKQLSVALEAESVVMDESLDWKE